MTARGTNTIVKIENGVAWIDVSTNKFPNHIAKIDEIDLPNVIDGRGRWRAIMRKTSGPYAARWTVGAHERETLLHRWLTGTAGSKVLIDHRNHDGLDNRRENFREANHSQNASNARSHRDALSSGYLGVDKHADGHWRARYQRGKRAMHIGLFKTEVDAARAYDDAVRHDPFANLNFPEASAA